MNAILVKYGTALATAALAGGGYAVSLALPEREPGISIEECYETLEVQADACDCNGRSGGMLIQPESAPVDPDEVDELEDQAEPHHHQFTLLPRLAPQARQG